MGKRNIPFLEPKKHLRANVLRAYGHSSKLPLERTSQIVIAMLFTERRICHLSSNRRECSFHPRAHVQNVIAINLPRSIDLEASGSFQSRFIAGATILLWE